jgi:hypothetical protein
LEAAVVSLQEGRCRASARDQDTPGANSRPLAANAAGSAAAPADPLSASDPWAAWNNLENQRKNAFHTASMPPNNCERDRVPFELRSEGIIGNLGWDTLPSVLLSRAAIS